MSFDDCRNVIPIQKLLLVVILAIGPLVRSEPVIGSTAGLQTLWSEQNYRQVKLEIASDAESEVPIAQLLLGFIYEYGLEGHRDSIAATYWFKAAAKSGLQIAELALSDNASSNDSADSALKAFGYSYVKPILSDAPLPFDLAPFTVGRPDSRTNNLLLALQFNRSTALKEKVSWAYANTASLLEEPENSATRNPFNLSLHYKQKALELEDPSILYEQGLMQKWGFAESPQSLSTREYFEKASEKGHRQSLVELGKLLIDEENSKTEIQKGLQLIESGSRVDLSELEDLAELFHDGEKVEKDMRRALPLYTRAALDGARHSASEAGRFFEFGWAGEKDPAKAERFYRLSAARGSYWGAYNLGRFLLNRARSKEESDEAIRWLEFSAHQENTKASIRLADLYEKGTQWVKSDSAKRTYWLKWAALQESADAHLALGVEQVRDGSWLTDQSRFDEAWASLTRALALENYKALLHMQRILTTRNGPRYEPTNALRLLETYHDRYPPAMLASARLKLSNLKELNDPEESKRLIESYHLKTGGRPPLEHFHSVLLYPDLYDDPVAKIKANLLELVGGDPAKFASGNHWARIYESDTIDEMRNILALELASKFPVLEETNPRYTIKGRKQITMVDPKLEGWLGGIMFEMHAKIAFKISPTGEVSDSKSLESNHPLAALIMRRTVERWRWEPATDLDSSEIPVSIRLDYNP